MTSTFRADEKRKIIVINDSETDPVLNLRKDDEIFEKVESGIIPECVRFWTDQECLVRGKTRSSKYGWFNEELATRLRIPIHERSTGGGVVYHDLGNLNWTFYLNNSSSFLSTRKVFVEPTGFIVAALRRLGIQAEFSPPNRVEVEGKKVSGMAARASIKALLVHGTLLLRTNLQRLNELCVPPVGTPPVSNLSEWKENISSVGIILSTVQVLRQSGLETVF